jgi:hypothetical protein
MSLATAMCVAIEARAADSEARVVVLKTPDGGIQPQAAIDREGTIHLLYFRGDPYHGDLFYTRRETDAEHFTTPVRVNSQPGTAVAVGTIRGGQLALGRNGRVHVVWNGPVDLRAKDATHEGAALFYSRREEGSNAFTPQRDLIQHTSALDGGGTIAADAGGHVYAAWHGRPADAPSGEANRALWVARSTDDGATFAPEAPALTHSTGACACCGTRALATPDGTLYVLYRAARRNVERDMMLLVSHDHALQFEARPLQPWPVNVCPMSSESLAITPDGRVVAAWETQGEVSFARVARPADRISPPGRPNNRKHPSVAVNARGEVLLAWTEGTGWQKGGDLAWLLFDAAGRPTADVGRIRSGIPVWSLPTVVAGPDGRFVVIH